MQDFNQPDIIFHRRTILEPIENCGTPACMGSANIRASTPKHQPVWMGFDIAVPADHIFNSLAEIFVIANRDMYRCQMRLCHFIKQGRRPVCILQIINIKRFFRHIVLFPISPPLPKLYPNLVSSQSASCNSPASRPVVAVS